MPYCNDPTNFRDKANASEKTRNQIINPSINRINRKNVSWKKTYLQEAAAVSENKEDLQAIERIENKSNFKEKET